MKLRCIYKQELTFVKPIFTTSRVLYPICDLVGADVSNLQDMGINVVVIPAGLIMIIMPAVWDTYTIADLELRLTIRQVRTVLEVRGVIEVDIDVSAIVQAGSYGADGKVRIVC